MDLSWMIWIYHITIVAYLSGVADGQKSFLTIDVTPSDRVPPGGKFTITCSVDTSKTKKEPNFIRKVGDLSIRIGAGAQLASNDFYNTGRYNLMKNNEGSFSLSVRNVQYFDTAHFLCTLDDSTVSEQRGVAVCDDVSSDSCQCLLHEPIPQQCYQEPPGVTAVKEGYQRTVIGLGVLLAIVIIYGIIMSAIVGRDFIAAANRKRQEQFAKMKAASQAVHAKPITSETSETTKLDPNANDSFSQLDTSLPAETSGQSTPQRGIYQPKHPQYPKQEKSEYSETQARPRPQGRQVGRQGERNQQQPQHAHSNPGYSQDEAEARPNLYQEQGGASPAVGYGDIGYAPHPSSAHPGASNPYGIGSHGGARSKNNSASAFTPVSTSSASNSAQPSPRYNPHEQSGASTAHQPAGGHVSAPAPPVRASSHEVLADARYKPHHHPSSTSDAPDYSGSQYPTSAYVDRKGHQADVNPRTAYTDQPSDRYRQGQQQQRGGYSEPKKLDFIQGNGQVKQMDGAYVDESDTVV